MLKKRIIPLLLFMNERLVKTIKFENFKDVGNPISAAKIFNDSDADELIFLDINRKSRSLPSLIQVLKEASKECFIPIAVGGGIKSFEDANEIIKNGADKIIINSVCYDNYDFVKNLANKFGSQSIVASIDVRKLNNEYYLFSNFGRKLNQISLKKHILNLLKNNVGEIMINLIDIEGTMKGPDLELAMQVSNISEVPIIYTGGIGNYDQIKDIFNIAKVSAVACGSLFNFTDSNPIRVKSYLKSQDINLRIF